MEIDASTIRISVGDKDRVLVDVGRILGGFCGSIRIMPGFHKDYDGGRAWTARREGSNSPYILLAPSSVWKKDLEAEGFHSFQELTEEPAPPPRDVVEVPREEWEAVSAFCEAMRKWASVRCHPAAFGQVGDLIEAWEKLRAIRTGERNNGGETV